MKPERRFNPPVFNPEKFLAQEKQKAAAKLRPRQGLFLPVSFSKDRLEALIGRVLGDKPDAFYLGPDAAKNKSLQALWTKEIGKELTVYGIAPDPMLILYLLAGVISHPLYKRAARKRKST
ncbi:MAG: hypothetical protein QM715_00040 [Nibricoccus sp.]